MRTSSERGIALITTLLVMMLISALLVGFTAIVMSDQRYRFIDRDRGQAFYAASGAMEKLTADLGNMFFANLAPTGAMVTALTATSPVIPGITYTTVTAPTALPASLLSSYTCGPAPLVTQTVGTLGYTITFCTNATGNPVSTSTGVVKSGVYQGLTAAQTPYQLDVTAKTSTGGEVHLVRTVESVAIPVFQFGMFSDVDLSFFAGPNFNFGGRVHTNGNLFLAQGGGATLTLPSQVDAVLEVVRQTMQNGVAISNSPTHDGTVSLAKAPGVFRNLAATEGSLVGGIGSALNAPTWHSISLSTYNSYITNGLTGAKTLNLPLITAGGANPDLIRRPLPGENTSNPQLYGERLFGKASLRILLSDKTTDITGMPSVTATAPISLGNTVADSNWNTTPPANYLVSPTSTGFCAAGPSGSCPPIARTPGPIVMSAASNLSQGWSTIPVNAIPALYQVPQLTVTKGATVQAVNCTGRTPTTFTGCTNPATGNKWTTSIATGAVVTLTTAGSVNSTSPTTTTNGVWNNSTTITVTNTALFSPAWFYVPDANTAGTNVLVSCNSYDSTVPQFSGCAATNTYANPPYAGTPKVSNGVALTTNALSTAQLGTIGGYIKIEKQDTTGTWTDVTAQILSYGIGAPNLDGQACADPTPNAIIRLQRLRDNGGGTPTSNGGGCNYLNTASSIITTNAMDYWPNALFDTREGVYRDNIPATSNTVTMGGVMYYVALDAQNLAQWFMGVAPYNAAPFLPNGTNALTNNGGYTVYFSDRRNNRNASSLETAEYGWEDFVNPLSANGTPDGTLETGEDVNGNGILDVYGGEPAYNGVYNSVPPPGTISPYTTALAAPLTQLIPGQAQVNRAIFFRRALKLVDGRNLRPITAAACACPGITGLTIVSENPVYIQGDWNANDANNGFTGTGAEATAATSVLADAVTLLSNEWVDTESFTNPYTPVADTSGTPLYTGRPMATPVWFRLAIAAGKGQAFPWPSAGGPPNDFGTDGGAHNFLRFLEDGGPTTVNYSGSLATFFYNRQAVGTYKCCATVYGPPIRAFAFDTNFTNPALLPPNTPVFRDINAVGFSQEIRPGR